ncbi:MAG: DUF1559 domain-containing protein [Pirellulales bacterium]|nr:DUF1559 domain-containing protein [Pirellulales bacterium]
MKKIVLGVLITIFSAVVSMAHAAEAFDAAARAKAIAPFIEEETVLLVRVDVSRIDADVVMDWVARAVPELEPNYPNVRKQYRSMLAAIAKANVRELYYGMTLAGPLSDKQTVFAVVPLPEGTDRRAAARDLSQGKLLRELGKGHLYAHVARKGNALVAGTRETVERLAKLQPDVRPELEKAFEAAGDTTVQVLLLPPKHTARTFEEMMPELPKKVGGGPSRVLTKGCLWAAVGVELPPKMAAHAVIQSADDASAEALLTKLKSVGQMLSDNKTVGEHVPHLEKVFETLTPRVEGDRLVLRLDEENQGVARLVALLKPPIEKARDNAQRVQSMNNLKMIGLAMHNWHDAHKTFPAAASYDKDGRPLLSWRVHILPYVMDDPRLYGEFHLDEPWDSPHNKKLIARMPTVYRSPASKLSDKGRTNYVVATGEGTVFSGKKGTSIRDITDGTSATIMVVEADDTHAPVWTKPEDLPFDPTQPRRGLGGLRDDKCFMATFCDGSVHALSPDIAPEVLRRLFLKADGEVVNYDDIDKPRKK